MPQSPTVDGASTGAAQGNTNGAALEVVHRTRSALGKRERVREERKSLTPETETEAEVEQAKLARQLDKVQSTLNRKLVTLETSIAEMEEAYIAETWTSGNVLRGWDVQNRRPDRNKSTGNGAGTATGAPKHRRPRPGDRIFSLSSASSALRREGPELKKVSDKKKKKKR